MLESGKKQFVDFVFDDVFLSFFVVGKVEIEISVVLLDLVSVASEGHVLRVVGHGWHGVGVVPGLLLGVHLGHHGALEVQVVGVVGVHDVESPVVGEDVAGLELVGCLSELVQVLGLHAHEGVGGLAISKADVGTVSVCGLIRDWFILVLVELRIRVGGGMKKRLG